MPVARFQMPDGRVARFEVPEGTTPEQAHTMISQSMAGKQEQPYNPTDTMSTGQRVMAGIGQGMTSAGRAMLQGISKITGADSVGAGLVKQSEIDAAKEVDAPLLATTSGRVGSGLGKAATALPAALIPGANTYAGAALVGAGTGASMTEGDLGERAKAAIGGALGGVAGKGLGNLLGWGVPKIVQGLKGDRLAAQAANAQRDASVISAKEAGYVLPPSDVNPSMLNEALGGLSGKIKTAQVASAKNQDVTNRLAKQALGISDDTPLNAEALNGIRRQAGQAYEAVKGIGTVRADQTYTKALDSLKSQYEGAAKDFPQLARGEVTSLLDSLKKSEFDASSAVDAVRVLRETADKAFRSGDSGLGKAAKAAAGEMEDLLERNLQASGAPASLVSAFKDARKVIAKTYTVQKALNNETGDVSAPALAALLKRGKPLSGDLETIAKIGTAFPKATQALKESPKAMSPLDYMAGLMGAGSTGPLGAAAVMARPAVRSMLLSKGYQGLLANPQRYNAGLLESSLPGLADPRLLGALPLTGGLLGVEVSK